MKKIKIFLAGIMLVAVFLTGASQVQAALTSQQIQAILSVLNSFGADSQTVQNVDDFLHGRPLTYPTDSTTETTQSSGSFCHTWNTNLRVGDRGADVRALAIALTKEGVMFAEDGNIELFSERRASSVVDFQEKYASEILAPYGLSRGTGFVGSSTRAKLNALYKCDNPNDNISDLSYLMNSSGERNVIVAGEKTWAYGTNLSNYVSVLVKLDNEEINENLSKVNRSATQDSRLELVASDTLKTGNSTVWLETPGGSRSNTIKVRTVVKESVDTSSITVLSPNGGETLTEGQAYRITWNSSGIQASVNIDLVDGFGRVTRRIAENVPNNGSYNWSVPKDLVSETSGVFKIIVGANERAGASDMSNGQFRIVSGAQQTPTITVLSPNGGESFNPGSTIPVSFSFSPPSFNHIPIGTDYEVSLVGTDTSDRTIDRIVTHARIISSDVQKSSFAIPSDFSSGSYRVRIAISTGGVLYQDQSNSNFIINSQASAQPSITVLSPNGGEVWQLGKEQTISWKGGPTGYDNLSIGVYVSVGTSDFIGFIPSKRSLVFNSSIKWDGKTVCSGSSNEIYSGCRELTGGSYKIMVTAVDTQGITSSDISDNTFTITAPISTSGKPLACGTLGDVDNDGTKDSLPGCTVDTATAEPFSIASALLSDGKLTLTYSKDFTTCAHLLRNGGFSPIALACSTGTSVTQSFSGSGWTVGDSIRLCHGNDYGQCTDTVKITSETSYNGLSESQRASVLDSIRKLLGL